MDAMIKRPLVNGVTMHVLGGRAEPIPGGTLCVSAFYLIFSSRRQSSEDEITVLHTAIATLDYVKGSAVTTLYLKDFCRLQLEFQSAEECKDTVECLERLSIPETLDQLPAFNLNPRDHPPSSGWGSSSPSNMLEHWKCVDRFRVCNINKKFKLCPSYPEQVIVPSSISDEDVIKVAQFRQGRRFPVICFHHQLTKAVLVRCGQPLCGHTQKKLKEDCSMLNMCLPSRSRGKIIDTRPQSLAAQHISKGGGVEMPAHYPQWKVEHAKFESPSSLQTSLMKLMDACHDVSLSSSSSWFGRVENSGWLGHVTRLLDCARRIVLTLHNDGSSVVVHGSTSYDVTLQLTSLAQVLLDYRCRTMVGFVGLVEREWLDGGHPFSIRHHPVTRAPERERAPVFLLFIDAVWQVMQQYPLSFQFNECFLHTLFVNSYSSVYGNFLYDTPKERIINKLKQRTRSLWDLLAQPTYTKNMLNPIYEKNTSVLLITVTALNASLWKRLYLRTDAAAQLFIPGYEQLRLLKADNASCHEKLQEVQRELKSLQLEGRKYTSNWIPSSCDGTPTCDGTPI